MVPLAGVEPATDWIKFLILSLRLRRSFMKNCKKCNALIPNTFKIDGKRHIINSRKYCLSCSPFKKHNTQKLEKSNSSEKFCPRCKDTKPISKFYKRRNKEGGSVYCKVCTSEQTTERQRALKSKAIEYKGGKCTNCGYDKCNAALTFHHLDPNQKEFTIAHCAHTSFNKVKEELDKCILLCYNCHMELHNPNI